MATIMEKDVLLEIANYRRAMFTYGSDNWKLACIIHDKLLILDYQDIDYESTLNELKQLEIHNAVAQ